MDKTGHILGRNADIRRFTGENGLFEAVQIRVLNDFWQISNRQLLLISAYYFEKLAIIT
jgi:hypothetical protein